MFQINGCDYKRMPYTISHRIGDDIVLFNMVTREMLVIEADRYEAFKEKAIRNEAVSGEATDRKIGCNSSDGTLLSDLIEKRFLVPADTDLDRWLEGEKDRSADNMERVSKFTIMTTTDCNAACPYCYELGRRRSDMTDQTAEDVAAYIVKAAGDRDIIITWFGGEPLCNKRAADIITKRLRDSGKNFTSEIVTNGYIFDEKTVRIARNHWKLKRAQITLDGTEDVYNNTRAYRNAEGSPYRRVMDNIELLSRNGIFVKIRLNVTKYNMDDLRKLACELGKRFRGVSNISAYASPVISYSEYDDGGFLPEERFLALDSVREMETALEEYDLYNSSPPKRTLNPFGCMAEDPDAVVITPLGTLGKCYHHSEDEQFGSIYSPEYDESVLESWKERLPEIKECRDCFYRPECIRRKKCPLTFPECTQKDREYLFRECVREVLAGYEEYQLKGKYRADNIKLAGHVFHVEYRYDYFSNYCREFFTKEEPETRIRITDEDIDAEEKLSDVDMSRDYYESLAVYRKICDYLIDYNIALFHGSALMVDGGAYIFTGPSGTGKSTHAALWREYLADRVTMINDDKPLLAFEDNERTGDEPLQESADNGIIVYGTPYSGKSQLHTDISAPLQAIIVLRQAKENRIRRLVGRELFIHLYPQLYRPKSQDKMEKMLDMLNRLLQVPVYLLECTPTKEAFDLVREELNIVD